MLTLWSDEKFKYDGTQLKPLFNYLNFSLLGDSILSWAGPCDVSLENMVDGEDFITNSAIAGDEMLHFLIEVFDRELVSGVLLQRLMASMIKDLIEEKSSMLQPGTLVRDGDDLYLGDRKISISIASQSPNSTLVHFAINIVNTGTPVKTAGLQDFELNAKEFSLEFMECLSTEWRSILEASRKVRPL
jgi:hypothetical protein